MQRLFSTFPNGWPGCGLLLLRASCAVPALIMEAAEFSGWSADPVHWLRLFGCLAALCILAGFWTPFAASCVAFMQGASSLSADAFWPIHLVLAMTAASLVMLGPGAWSIDARLYGRKRIDLQR